MFSFKLSLIALFLGLTSQVALAQRYSCQVNLVNNRGNILRTFRAIEQNGVCREGLRACNLAKREYSNPSLLRCQTSNISGPGQPSQISRYLNLSDYQLVSEAQRGIGQCHVSRGGWNSACSYYTTVSGRGYPAGTGCADIGYQNCNTRSQEANVACLVRNMLRSGACRI
jgi:hypothetical protein